MKYILSEKGRSLPVGVDAHFRRFSSSTTENWPTWKGVKALV